MNEEQVRDPTPKEEANDILNDDGTIYAEGVMERVNSSASP